MGPLGPPILEIYVSFTHVRQEMIQTLPELGGGLTCLPAEFSANSWIMDVTHCMALVRSKIIPLDKEQHSTEKREMCIRTI